MARGINKAIILGNLGQDPTIRYTAGGAAVTSFSIATSETWKDKNTGEPQERTEWHNVVFFGKLAEIAGQYLKKGSKIYIEGKLQTRKWQDKNGIDRYSTEIIAHELQMLGGPQRDQYSNDDRPDHGREPQPQVNDGTQYENAFNSMPDPNTIDEEIPF